MSGDIPEWALDRAAMLASPNGEYPNFQRAFARYIAAHEEPPVDPLLIEARKIVSDVFIEQGAPNGARAALAGEGDNWSVVVIALAALNRGMELAARGDA